MRYLLDSSVILDHLRGHGPATWLITRLLDEGADLLICDIVVAEVTAAVPDEARETVDLLLDELEYVCIGLDQARHAGAMRGKGSALEDALVAATARHADATVVARGRAGIEASGVGVLTY